MFKQPKVLLLSSDEAIAGILQTILSRYGILTRSRNIPEMQRLLEDGDYDVLLCAWSFPLGTWKDALEVMQQCEPELPMIILSSTAGEQEWVQVLEAGAFDLLVPPYRERAVLSVLEQAVASREARLRHKVGILQAKAN